MSSYDIGKAEIVAWVRMHYPKGATCLDVGACDGKWWNLLGDYLVMDAVEVWEPNIRENDLERKYRRVFCADIRRFWYKDYDLVIFGDVLEHMSVEDAQKVLHWASLMSKDYIIGVPFNYPQDEIYGNPYERHIQDDLTPELFDERYPGHELLLRPTYNYAYYHMRDSLLK